MIRKLTLEQRIARLERLIKNEKYNEELYTMLCSRRPADVKAALEAGADPDMKKGRRGLTPLMVCAMYDYAASARILIRAGADVNAKRDDSTVLDFAYANDSMRVVKILEDAGAELGERNKQFVASVGRPYGGYKGAHNI